MSESPSTTIPHDKIMEDDRRNNSQAAAGLLEGFLAYIENPESFDKDLLKANIRTTITKLINNP